MCVHINVCGDVSAHSECVQCLTEHKHTSESVSLCAAPDFLYWQPDQVTPELCPLMRKLKEAVQGQRWPQRGRRSALCQEDSDGREQSKPTGATTHLASWTTPRSAAPPRGPGISFFSSLREVKREVVRRRGGAALESDWG